MSNTRQRNNLTTSADRRTYAQLSRVLVLEGFANFSQETLNLIGNSVSGSRESFELWLLLPRSSHKRFYRNLRELARMSLTGKREGSVRVLVSLRDERRDGKLRRDETETQRGFRRDEEELVTFYRELRTELGRDGLADLLGTAVCVWRDDVARTAEQYRDEIHDGGTTRPTDIEYRRVAKDAMETERVPELANQFDRDWDRAKRRARIGDVFVFDGRRDGDSERLEQIVDEARGFDVRVLALTPESRQYQRTAINHQRTDRSSTTPRSAQRGSDRTRRDRAR